MFHMWLVPLLFVMEAALPTMQSDPDTEQLRILDSLIQSRILNNRSYIEEILKLNKREPISEETSNVMLRKVIKVYHSAVEPLENAYKYSGMGHPTLTNGELSAKPMILFLGPWSTGKSTMINYLVGMNGNNKKLHTGAEPTTTDFTVVMHGDHTKTVEGIVLTADSSKPFSQLEKFGQTFLEKLLGYELPHPLLKKAIFVDTPGIIENRKQQERGYPFNDVTQWFVDRSDLIFVVFDPTKLDVGSELEILFRKLKGRESQIRLILNKADSIEIHELMRVYGALFWSLAPLINVTEPPRVYVGSFWPGKYKENRSQRLFMHEEISLLHDINDAVENSINIKIARLRQHAINIRIHALIVDRYINVWTRRKSGGKKGDIIQDILDKPDKYGIFSGLLNTANISKWDIPSQENFKRFFNEHPFTSFTTLKSRCGMLSGCPMDVLEHAISHDLPNLLIEMAKAQMVAASCSKNKKCGSPAAEVPTTKLKRSNGPKVDLKTKEFFAKYKGNHALKHH